MGEGKLTEAAREMALCVGSGSGAFDPATEHGMLAGLMVLFVSAAVWMFRRWPSRPAREAAGATERVPSSREPVAEALSPRPTTT